LTRLPRHYVAARRSFTGELAAGAQDFVQSFEKWPLWKTLAFNDIMSRYRGSLLGPNWITLTTVAFVVGISLIYGNLMHVSTQTYVPWIATGVVIWNAMAATILESGDAYISSSAIIRAGSLPLPMFVWRVIFRNVLNFGHQAVVIVGVALWFHFLLKMNLPMILVGFALLLFNLSWMAFFSAIAAARFRDIQQVISTLMQLIFFVSPVIWIPDGMHGGRGLLLLFNPFFHLLEVTRSPLLGLATPVTSILILLALGSVGWTITFLLYASVRRRIVHYL
jgi:ABC-type polysaccharide/polyol phosphate export permease